MRDKGNNKHLGNLTSNKTFLYTVKFNNLTYGYQKSPACHNLINQNIEVIVTINYKYDEIWDKETFIS